MKPYPFQLTENTLTLYVDGKVLMVTKEGNEGQYNAVRSALREKDFAKAAELANIRARVEQILGGEVKVIDDVVYYKDEPVQNHMADKIIYFAKAKDDTGPLVNFMNKIMDNPSKRSIDELHKFLEHKNLPITPEGDFLAYKAVRNDWKDKHSGTFDNSIGATPRVDRNKVDDDARAACSYGLHVGSLRYVQGFAYNYGNPGGDRILVVRVNPADVVSVPYDSNCEKVRCAGYTVEAEYTGPLPEYYTSNYSPNYVEEFDEQAFNDVEELVWEVLGDELNVYADNFDVHGALYLESDLGLDDLDMIDFTMGLEDKFNIELNDEEVMGFDTLQDVIELVFEKVNG